jgi:curli biogenesis system outer membrane secretion channel CsgG
MRMLRPRPWLLLATALVALPCTAAAQSKRPTVALVDFDFASIQRWWDGNQDIGKGIADMVVDGLVEDGTYRVIERKRLDAVLAEQDFSNSDRADPSQAEVVKIGKALGVKYLVIGSVTKFGMEDKNTRVGGGLFGARRFGVGDVGTKKGKATVAITARMIDTTTGEIMASAKGEATSSRSGLLLGAATNRVGGRIEFGSSNFRDTVLGEATEAAVLQVVNKLIASRGRLDE